MYIHFFCIPCTIVKFTISGFLLNTRYHACLSKINTTPNIVNTTPNIVNITYNIVNSTNINWSIIVVCSSFYYYYYNSVYLTPEYFRDRVTTYTVLGEIIMGIFGGKYIIQGDSNKKNLTQLWRFIKQINNLCTL